MRWWTRRSSLPWRGRPRRRASQGRKRKPERKTLKTILAGVIGRGPRNRLRGRGRPFQRLAAPAPWRRPAGRGRPGATRRRDCLARLADSVFQDKLLLAGVKRSRLVRAAHVSAARAIFDAFPEDRLRDRFAALVFRRTTDADAGVRSAAVGATRVLFRRFLPEKHNAIFATLSDGRSENERAYFVLCRREFEATSLVTVADMAVSSARVTRAALYHLLRRSVRPELASAVRRLTERLAAGLGFASGPALLREHLMFLMSRWLSDRSSLGGFPFELLGHAGRAGGDGGRGRGGGDALRACAHVAVPLVVIQLGRKDRLREVQAMAGELGMGSTDNGVARLVRLHVADIKAVYLPKVANEADGFLQRVIDGGKVGKASDNLQTLVLRLLDMGAVESFGAFGRVTLRSIADTLEQVAGQLDGAGSGAQRANARAGVGAGAGDAVADAGDLLRRVNFVEVVLHLRGHIARARGAEAQRRVFGMLEFVVTRAHAEEDASCLSSTVSVLLGAAKAASSSGGVGGDSGGDGDDEAPDGGAASVVKLMDDVFGRCMSTSRGRALLGRHFGAVVEQLVAVFTDLDAVRRRAPSRSTAQRAGQQSSQVISGKQKKNKRSPATPLGAAGPQGREEQEQKGEECARVANLVLDLLRALVVDSPASMSSHVSRLHPFPEGSVSSSTGLRAVSQTLATRKELEAVGSGTARLVEGAAGEGGAPSSSSRAAGSLLANLSHLRAALRRQCRPGPGEWSSRGRPSGRWCGSAGPSGRRPCTSRPLASRER
ncbi:unnamed protein product [Scytosiphon promiscuus]